MAIFVHLTAEKNVKSIRQNGIKFEKKEGYRRPHIFAMPVTRNFYVSHQWLRELKRSGQRTFVGIYFRLPDEEEVLVGHYNSGSTSMKASQAVALMMGIENNDPQSARHNDEESKAVKRGYKPCSSPEGYEVLIQRRIAAKEIFKVKALPQVLGWRYSPGAHSKPPCVCLCCERGAYGITKLRKQVEEAERKGVPSKVVMFGR